ncbi:MAG: hypothetical protein KA369_01580 [Spirochaetes bacterium]|nr:hypothetical protein [Spirochaetota bacterium]
MKVFFKVIASLAAAVAAIIAGVFIYFAFFYTEPVYIRDHSATIPEAAIQPAEAIRLAAPYLPEHGTYVYRKDRPLVLHLSRHKDWYYVMRTNYPAKTIRYYLQPAVKVHAHTGKIEFSTR